MNQIVQSLREDAVAAFHAAVAAVQPAGLLTDTMTVDGDRVAIRGEALPRVSGRRVVTSLGKAAPGLADAWIERAPGWADEIFVLAPHDVPVTDRVRAAADVHSAGHPYPDASGESATTRLIDLARSLGQTDLLIVLLSGGSSALLAAPVEGVTREDVATTTRALMEAGATINQVNTVRRQLLAATGGGLAQAASPARVVTLVLSDVPGDPLADIGSGPTVRSPTTAADALGVLGGLALVADLPRAVIDVLRSRVDAPSDASWEDRSRVQILANNRTAVHAAASMLTEHGYATLVHPGYLEGEASTRGTLMAQLAAAFWSRRRVGFLMGGETTVTVRGSGRGGRNHELALAAAMGLDGPSKTAILSAGTDGIDGRAEGAGAVVDPTTVARLRNAGIDPMEALANNDAGTALAAVGDSIVTGPTGTNVCDVTMVLTA
jgi:glycerate-2-kinase